MTGRSSGYLRVSVRGDVDFGIVIDPGAVSDWNVKWYSRSPFYCSAAMMILWHRCRRWPRQALQGANPVLQDYASGSRPLIDAALTAQGVKATIVQEIGHPATLFPMVEAGIGISVLPALALPLPQGESFNGETFRTLCRTPADAGTP